MDRFQSIITVAVRHAKARQTLLWADRMAERIANSTPLDVDRAALGERLTAEAVRQGVAVTVARRTETGRTPSAAVADCT